jgi:carbon storage regulator
MLVLSRKKGQSLVIAGNTVVRVLEIKGNQIRLGIEAPDDVAVMRTELSERQVAHSPAPGGRESRDYGRRNGHNQEPGAFQRRSR